MQKYILDRLRLEQPLSYSQMMPTGIESSQFMYHLKSLIKSGLVQKESRGVYKLTLEGNAALEYLSVNQLNPIRMPKTITYTLITHKGEMLLLRKQKAPYRGLLEPIAGKVHFGEDAGDAAQRELQEKLGLTLPKPVFAGIATMLITQGGKPITHMTVYAHQLELKMMPDHLPENVVISSLDTLASEQCIPGVLELIKAVLNKEHPFVTSIEATAEL